MYIHIFIYTHAYTYILGSVITDGAGSESGIWNSESGTWDPESGIRNLVSGIPPRFLSAKACPTDGATPRV